MKIRIISLVIILLLYANTARAYPNSIYLEVVPSEIQFQMVDPAGNKTGYDPATGVIENIPNTIYILHQEMAITGEKASKYQKGYSIEPVSNQVSNQISTGKYQLKIYGSNIVEQYLTDLTIYYEQATNDMRYPQHNKTLIYPNAVWIYEFDVPATPSPDGKLVVTKVATPADLVKDLTSAGQLGYIGNAKFVAEITKEINEIEAERSKVNPSHGSGDDGLTSAQKAKKEYTELLKEITEKYNKPESDEFVKQEAYTVLKEDLEYIIGHM